MAEDQRRIELKVAGMTCAMCARTIEHALRISMAQQLQR
jgi:cation transport ATPase